MQQTFLTILWVLGIDLVLIGIFAACLAPLAMFKKAAFAVLKRNFVAYFSNPTGYAFLCVFVLFTSLFAFCRDEFFTSNLANLDQLNQFLPVLMLGYIPAITMAIWAEERRQGTDELLLTLPATDFDIVIGKYLASASIFTSSLLFSQITSLAVLITLSDGTLDTGLLFSTYTGYWLMGLAMLALGMVPSFLTSNLTVAFILGVIINAPLVGLGYADQAVSAGWAATLSQWGLLQQFDDFGRGMITLGSTAYFLTIIFVGLYLSMVLIGRRHWLGGRDGSSLLGHYLLRILAIAGIAIGLNYVLINHDRLRQDLTEKHANSPSPDTIALIGEFNLGTLQRRIKALETEVEAAKNKDKKTAEDKEKEAALSRELAAKKAKEKILAEKKDFAVEIDAFMSASPPPQYVRTKAELISLLKEFEAKSGGKIKVNLHANLEPFSEEAVQAEKRFGIKSQAVQTRTRGAIKSEDVIMGASFRFGLQKVVVPFIDSGIPVEYELIRSINTVAWGAKKKLGVVRTDAQLYGGFTFGAGGPQNIPKEAIIEELEKQYEVEEVDPNTSIDPDKYDVLLVAQPSSLGPQELDNLIEVVKKGTPIAIFEDPLPQFLQGAPGTGQPKRQNPMMAMMGGGGPPPPKGDIRRLWNALGIKVPGNPSMSGMGFDPDVVWQDYNPYRKLQIPAITAEWIFIRNEMPGADQPFNPKEPASAGLEELLFVIPGAIAKDDDEIGFEKLVSTGNKAGTIKFADLTSARDPDELESKRKQGSVEQILAARIFGQTRKNPMMAADGYEVAQKAGQKPDPHAGHDHAGHDHAGHDHAGHSHAGGTLSGKDDEKKDDKASVKKNRKDGEINAIYVSDIDCLSRVFIQVRSQPADSEINFRFDNVTFILNIIDVLAGDEQYVDIRKPRVKYSTLKKIENVIEEAREKEGDEIKKFKEQEKEQEQKVVDKFNESFEGYQKIIDGLEERKRKGEEVDPQAGRDARFKLSTAQKLAEERIATEKEKRARDAKEKSTQIRREMDLKIQNTQRWYKVAAVALPPIPPLLVGLVVFVMRRLREREGISRARLL